MRAWHAEQILGQAGRIENFFGFEQHQRRDFARLDDAGVASDEGLDHASHWDDQGEIPRRYHADDAPRDVVHLALAVLHQMQR